MIARKHLRELRPYIEAMGVRVLRDEVRGRHHALILDVAGTEVALIVAISPSDWRWRNQVRSNVRHLLRKHGKPGSGRSSP